MEKSLNYTQQIMSLEEFYFIEDLGSLLMSHQKNKGLEYLLNFQNNLNKINKITNTTVRVNFIVNGREKEVLMEKKMLNKVYAIYKIYSENSQFFKILVNRTEKYDAKEILQKINSLIVFKGVLRCNFKIYEFPLKTYYLEEIKIKNSDNNTDEIEKEFILKKINNKINQNIMNNNMNSQIFDENKININNINQMNINWNKNDNFHFNQNFHNNNNNINKNFNQNNTVNIMDNNIIIQNLENNKFLIMQIFNYIRQNNNEQMNNYLQPIINCLNQIDKNMNYIMKLMNKNYIQINKNNFAINNNIFDNKDNDNNINNNNKIEKKSNINDSFLFKRIMTIT